MDIINVDFFLNGQPRTTKGVAICTKQAYCNGEVSERSIKEYAYSLILGYMAVKELKGKPFLVNWEFEYIK